MVVIESWLMAGIGNLVRMEQWKLRLYVEEGSQACGSLLWSFHQLYSNY